MDMSIKVTQGSYRWEAACVFPGTKTPWRCQEFANVGLETEGRINEYMATDEHVSKALFDYAQFTRKT